MNLIPTKSAESLAHITHPPMLISDILPEGSITCIVGPTYSGKTFYALAAACSVAFNLPFMGKWAVSPGNVLFIEQDAPEYDTGRALYAMLHPHLDALSQKEDGTKQMDALQLAWHPHLDLTRSEDVGRIAATARRLYTFQGGYMGEVDIDWYGTKLIILDTLRALHTADENSSTEMEKVMQGIKFIRQNTRAAILFLHHSTKPRFDAPLGIRGSSAIEAAVDNIFRITRNNKTDIISVRVEKARAIQPPDFNYTITTTETPAGPIKVVRIDEPAPKASKALRPEPTPKGTPEMLLAWLQTQPSPSRAGSVQWGALNGKSRATIYRWLSQLRNEGQSAL